MKEAVRNQHRPPVGQRRQGTSGEIIARRLGVRLYDKELLTLAARQSGLCAEFFEKADEKESRSVLSTMIGYLRSPFAGDCGRVTSVLSNDALFKIQSDVIRDVAERESCIFVGRCADYILREHPRRVDVFISASEADRIRRICARARAARPTRRVRRWSAATPAGPVTTIITGSKTWGAAATYHLCIDSSVFGDEERRISSWSSRRGNWNMKF